MYKLLVFNNPPVKKFKKIFVWALALPLFFYACNNASSPGGGSSSPDQGTLTGVGGNGSSGSPSGFGSVQGIINEGGWAGGLTVIDEDGSFKKILLDNGTEYPIGRKNTENINIKIDANGDLQFRDPDGDGYIPIGTYAEFQLINQKGLGDTHKDKKFRQIADIDLMNLEWTPVGNPANIDDTGFFGTYDGNSKLLDNLKITSSANYAGLFGYIAQGGLLKNICINSGNVMGNDYTGGIASYTEGVIITSCNKASVMGNDYTGGITGYNIGAINASYNKIGVTGNNYIGGIAGYSNGTIIASSNTGGIIGKLYIGGMAGYDEGIIFACYSTGGIKGDIYVGGIAGLFNGTITACYNIGSISGTSHYGALAGYAKSNASAKELYWEVGRIMDSVGFRESGNVTTSNQFSKTDWPKNADGWSIGDGSGSGKYWKNLGKWDKKNPVYPKLWWE